jgi:AAA domain-containing protein
VNRLSRLVKRGVVGQEPLPPAFPSWEERGMRIRRSSLHLWAGPSASYKTMAILNAILNMRVSTLMFSTDSDESTIASRILGILTQTPIESTESWLMADSEHLQRASDLLEPLDFIRWDFSPNPTLDDVWEGAYAYALVEGCWPQQIVIDIASDVGHDVGDNEWAILKDLMRQGKVLARETGAAVHLVHHVTDGWIPTAERPVPGRKDILGKLSAIPVLMVNFAPGEEGEIKAACVKNRFAKCDATGRDWFRMRVNPATGYVGDYIPGVSIKGGNWWQTRT